MRTLNGWLCWLAVVSLAAVSAAQTDAGYSLMIQQNLPDAGTVSPAGVQRFGVNQTVTISAQPRPGYQFVYWMGDVTDPGMMRTTVLIDSPKIVVAVFQEDEFHDLEPEFGGGGDGNGRAYGTGLSPNPARVSMGPAVSAGGVRVINNVVYRDIDGSDDNGNGGGGGGDNGGSTDVPVPGEVPEPATLVLLSLGSVVLMRRGRRA